MSQSLTPTNSFEPSETQNKKSREEGRHYRQYAGAVSRRPRSASPLGGDPETSQSFHHWYVI
jgi:hypothetical protein